jgi:hypothetical protein
MLRRRSWLSRLLLAGFLAVIGLPWAGSARAQDSAPRGMQVATAFLDRMVRLTVQPTPDSLGVEGFGFVVGEQRSAEGTLAVIIVTADHLLRDPARGGAPPYAVYVTFHADLSTSKPAVVLTPRLAPDAGDLAVLAMAKPANINFPPAYVADARGLLPGDLVWQDGRSGIWTPAAQAGRFALRDAAGWLLFDGIDGGPAAAGSALLSERGLVGMVVAPTTPGAPPRALGADTIAAKFSEWGINWALPPASAESAAAKPLASITAGGAAAYGGSAESRQAAAATPGIRPIGPRATEAGANAPGLLVEPMAADAARARSSWVPAGARVSPWQDRAASLLAAPRPEAARISALPQGLQLPRTVWLAGAYEVVRKLDGGAWFLLASDGNEIGYASGRDVIELWPLPAGPPAGRVVRDWVLEADRHAVLRDAGTHYDLSQTFTPMPPAEGAIAPTFWTAPRRGHWRAGEVVPLHVLLPRAVVETPGARLLACIGLDAQCPEVTILGGH